MSATVDERRLRELLAGVPAPALGRRLKRARVANDLTQTDVAGDDCSVGFLSRIENGQRRPDLPLLTAIAGRLAVTVEHLLTGGTGLQRYVVHVTGLGFELEASDALDAVRRAGDRLQALPGLVITGQVTTTPATTTEEAR